ncbi:MAG: trypsin-like peptidase domain-containing protein [Myxococcota bacterium]
MHKPALPRFAAVTCLLALLVTSTAALAQDDPLTAAEKHRQALFDRIAPSVVFIAHEGGLGSGFFVDSNGVALTNKHVVGDRDSVQIVLIDGRTRRAPVISRAKDLDLALIKVPIRDATPLELAGFQDVRIGSWVASVGHGAGGVWTYTTGMISNIYPAEGDRPVFQTQIPLNPGASGGPVFDKQGRVVGIVTSGIVESNSINFAIRSDAAIAAFDRLERAEPSTASAKMYSLEVRSPDGARIFVGQQMIGEGPLAQTQVEQGEHRIRVLMAGEMKEKTIGVDANKSIEFPGE